MVRWTRTWITSVSLQLAVFHFQSETSRDFDHLGESWQVCRRLPEGFSFHLSDSNTRRSLKHTNMRSVFDRFASGSTVCPIMERCMCNIRPAVLPARTNTKFKWGMKENTAFETLKESITRHHGLLQPNQTNNTESWSQLLWRTVSYSKTQTRDFNQYISSAALWRTRRRGTARRRRNL